MPTYEYQCRECGHLFEAFQKISEDPLKTCPVCGGGIKRLISSGVGLIFKGSGFYITDYKRGGSGEKKRDSKGTSETKTDKEKGKKSGIDKPADIIIRYDP